MVGAHVSIRNLSVSHGKHRVLRDVSLEIPRGKITVIVGPSGCGKSTLLRSLNRLVEPAHGTSVTGDVILDGQSIYGKNVDVTELRRKMGLIAQTPNPLPMSIYDNIAYGPRIHRLEGRDGLDRLVEQCLRAASLWDEVRGRLRAPASSLSVGQQQRLCLARALSVKPETLLCDEATSALDPVSAGSIEKQILELKERHTIVFVTHVLRQARRLADHVVFLYLGEVVEQGPTEALFSRPEHPQTQAYVEGVFS